MASRKDRIGRKVTAFFKRNRSRFAHWRTQVGLFFAAAFGALNWAHTADAAEGMLHELGLSQGPLNVLYWTLMFLLNRVASGTITVRSANTLRRKPQRGRARRRISVRQA